jgi:hypothetical protein
VAYGQGIFVAVALNTSAIAISKDGIDWEYQEEVPNLLEDTNVVV